MNERRGSTELGNEKRFMHVMGKMIWKDEADTISSTTSTAR